MVLKKVERRWLSVGSPAGHRVKIEGPEIWDKFWVTVADNWCWSPQTLQPPPSHQPNPLTRTGVPASLLRIQSTGKFSSHTKFSFQLQQFSSNMGRFNLCLNTKRKSEVGAYQWKYLWTRGPLLIKKNLKTMMFAKYSHRKTLRECSMPLIVTSECHCDLRGLWQSWEKYPLGLDA